MSVALQITTVVPSEKVEPDAGVQMTAAGPQLSEAGAENSTVASHRPRVAETTMLVGQSSVGLSVSRTVTLNAQVASLPLASLALHCTRVIPLVKSEPLGGRQVRFVRLQPSSPVTA